MTVQEYNAAFPWLKPYNIRNEVPDAQNLEVEEIFVSEFHPASNLILRTVKYINTKTSYHYSLNTYITASAAGRNPGWICFNCGKFNMILKP